MHRVGLLTTLLLAGCVFGKEGEDPPGLFEDQDADDDGVPYGEDCDDADPAVHPGAQEVCDAGDVDEDCDGAADAADPDATGTITAYHDADGDGFGNADEPATLCEVGGGYVADATDCDDADDGVHPGATERCDDLDVDEDCDGAADDADAELDPSTTRTLYEDLDGDGYGDPDLDVASCDVTGGLAEDGRDCDDGDPDVHPGATEYCNGWDDDCNAYIDEDSATDAPSWYRDADGDTYGDPDDARVTCEQPSGYVGADGDCDDTNRNVRPGATETCNDVDDDCDGTTDPDTSSGAPTWYADADRDGYGDAGTSRAACDQPANYVSSATDCDDTSSAVSPARTEQCDAADTDEDCDGLADDDDSSVSASTRSTWYRDADSDGYGTSGTSQPACDQPSGYVSNTSDCDDSSRSISPAGTEVCDAADADEDCDGASDDADASVSAGTTSTFYVDADRDGYGSTTTALRCDGGNGYAATSDDCDDTRSTVSPGDTEVCDAADLDEDCDGVTEDDDPSITAQTTWYGDADSDGYGDDGVTAVSCDQPAGYVATGGDCDDADGTSAPDAEEVCADEIDQDCDGNLACVYDETDADTTIVGATNDSLGSTLAWAGDPDGDGVSSLWIGAYKNPDGGGSVYNGAVYLVDAGSASSDIDSVRSLQYTYDVYNAWAGYAVAAGDWDRDGVEDVVIAAPISGYVWWVLGGGSGVERLSDQWGYSSGASARLGTDFGVGDADGDGDDDVLIGAPYASSYDGAAYLYTSMTESGGRISGIGTTFTGETETSSITYAGQSVALADLDGDGVDDAIVGSPYRDYSSNSSAGCAYVVYAPGTGTIALSGADARLRGSTSTYYVGNVVVADGDLDGDGLPDLLIAHDTGAYVFQSAPSGYLDAATAADFSVSVGGRILAATLEDLDGDGIGDLTVGVQSEATVWHFNGADGFSGAVGTDEADVQLDPGITGQFGEEVLVVPDWDGDGAADLIVSASDDTSLGGYGAVFVYSGTLFGAP